MRYGDFMTICSRFPSDCAGYPAAAHPSRMGFPCLRRSAFVANDASANTDRLEQTDVVKAGEVGGRTET